MSYVVQATDLAVNPLGGVGVGASVSRIPTGFRPPAQGCEATLDLAVAVSQPQRGCGQRPVRKAATPLGLWEPLAADPG